MGLFALPLDASVIAFSLIYMGLYHFWYVSPWCLALNLNLWVISVMTSTAIHLDRLFALLLELRYRPVIQVKLKYAYVRVVII